MKRPFSRALAALAVAIVVPAIASAGATDQEKFDRAVAKFAPSFQALFTDAPFKPKGLCVCTDAPQKPGFLHRLPDGTVLCGVPVFLPDGSFADVASICTHYEILSK